MEAKRAMAERHEGSENPTQNNAENDRKVLGSSLNPVNLQTTGNADTKMKEDKSTVKNGSGSESVSSIDFLLDIPLEITIELDSYFHLSMLE